MQKIILIKIFIIVIQTSLFAQINEVFTQKYSQYNIGGGEFITETPDGGYALIGTYYNNETVEGKHFLIRTDSEGNILWNKEFWDYIHHWDCSVRSTYDKGFIVCSGGTNGQLIKFDGSGNIIWDKSYGDEGYQFGRYGIQTSDSGYVFTGGYDSLSIGNGAKTKIWLVKTNQSGDIQWTRTFGERGYNAGTSVLQTADKGYLVSGEATMEEGNSSCFFLAKTDSSGHTEWSNSWFYKGAWWCRPEDTKQTYNGGYITVGVTADTITQVCSVYIVKTEASGDTVWTKKIKKGAWSWAYSVQPMANGNFIVVARTAAKINTLPEGYVNPDETDIWIFALNSNGEIEWEDTLGGPYSDEIHCLHKNSDDSYVFTGGYGIGQWNYDPWLVKFTIDENTGINKIISLQKIVELFQNFPNPCNLQTTIRYNLYNSYNVMLKIYNATGQEIETLQDGYQAAGEYNISWQPVGLTNGIYIYCLQTGDFLETKKLFLQK